MAYSTEQELTDYATARGITITGDKSVLLTKAHDYIESLDYIGQKTVLSQATKFPRAFMVVDDYDVPSDLVPNDIKKAEMQTALEIDAGVDPLDNIERATKSETLGDMSVTYMDNSAWKTRLTKVNAILRPYLGGGMGIKR
jgi:hypothetical protein